jgi:hypothetical protein
MLDLVAWTRRRGPDEDVFVEGNHYRLENFKKRCANAGFSCEEEVFWSNGDRRLHLIAHTLPTTFTIPGGICSDRVKHVAAQSENGIIERTNEA